MPTRPAALKYNPHRTKQGLPTFELKSIYQRGSGAVQRTMNVRCAECLETTQLPWTSVLNTPEIVTKKFQSLGWEFDAYKSRSCICPKCLSDSKPKPEPPPPPPPPELTRMEQPMALTQIPSKPPLPRALTADERAKVRALLDINFDDAKGMYIDGYSDQRIGLEANVPWASVASIREAAYGPIREDPLVTQLVTEIRAEIARLRSDMLLFSNRIEQVEAKINNLLKQP